MTQYASQITEKCKRDLHFPVRWVICTETWYMSLNSV